MTQMKSIKMAGLCLVAVFAFGAIVAAAAQASEPEWGRCVTVKKGFYSDSNCQTRDEKKGKPKGTHEWISGGESHCYAMKHGKYADSGCTTEDLKKGKPKGNFEKTPSGHFTGKGGAGVLSATVYECTNGEEFVRLPRADCEEYNVGIPDLEVECTNESAQGEAVGTANVANVSVRFTGCKIFGVLPCESAGLGVGEIETHTLKGNLGYINKGAHEVGVLLEPVAAGKAFAEFACEEVELKSVVGVGNATEGAFYTPETTGGYDGIISPITPVNKMTTTFTQAYKANPQRENIPSKFEGGHIELLETYLESTEPGNTNSYAWSPAGQTITNVNTVEGEAEIKG